MELIPGKLYKITFPFEKKIYSTPLYPDPHKKKYTQVGIMPPHPIVMLLDKGKIIGLSAMYEYKILYKDVMGYIDLPGNEHLKLITK